MQRSERLKRDQEILKLLKSIIGTDASGKPIHPTQREVAEKYGIDKAQVNRIKVKLVGKGDSWMEAEGA